MTSPTLADRLAALDGDRFRGRAAELTALEGVLDGGTGHRVAFVHGPGGIGKSALIREAVRRAASRGFTTRVIDGRDVLPVPGDIERALDGIAGSPRPLVVFDSYERMTGADGWLRQTLLPSLPDATVVLVASREPPADQWRRGGWEHLLAELELAPLSAEDALALVRARGVDDDGSAADLVAWARGWPLALSIATESPRGAVPRTAEDLDRDDDVLRTAIARIARAELRDGVLDAMTVAALARCCDRPLLAAVLPDADPDETLTWLSRFTFAEPVRGGISLHEVVRRAVRAEVEARRPDDVRELRRRIADHLHDRAAAGQLDTLIDLTELIGDPILRWGLGAEGSVHYRVSAVRPEDRPALAPWYAARPTWWADLDAFLSAAPEYAVLARDELDRLAGLTVAVPLSDVPPVAERDAVLSRWLPYARGLGTDAVLLWRDAADFRRDGDPTSPVVSLMNTAAILGSGLANVRYSFLPLDTSNDAAVLFSAGTGAQPVPELTVEIDGMQLACHVIDHGEGGMIGHLRDVLYADLQLPPGFTLPAPPPVSVEEVRDALRDFHRPTRLAASPLARGRTPEERAASVRARLTGGVATAFGDAPDEVALREILERGYLAPGARHEEVADALGLTRTTYFRRLRQATERLAAWLSP